MKKQHLIPVLAASLLLTACSFNPIGESSFDCNRKDNPSKYCRSFKALEKSTTGPLPESRFDKEFRMSDYDRATGIAPESSTDTLAANKPKWPWTKPAVAVDPAPTNVLPHNRYNAASELVPGAPVRRAPVIQRVLVKKFVDENDMLQGDVVVYKEVQASKWTGFDGVAATSGPGAGAAFPHRRKDSPVVGADADMAPASPGPSFNQPDATAEGSVGTVMPPAVQSGSK